MGRRMKKFAMPKQFTLQQTGRNGGTIQLHKRAIFASAAVVNGASDQLLACTCLSKQQDCRVAGSDRFNKFQNMAGEVAAVDNVIVTHSNCLSDYFWFVWMAAIVPTLSPKWECVRVSNK